MKELLQKHARTFSTVMLSAIFMCFATTATAQEDPEDPGQQIKIHTVEDMLTIETGRKGRKNTYVLMNDLTLDNWKPIGPFYGVFDGTGHTITVSMDIIFSDESKDFEVGLFSEIVGTFSLKTEGGVVKNLRVTGAIRCESPSKEINVGSIAGINRGGTISGCVSEVDVTVNAIESNTGGIVGFNREPTFNVATMSVALYSAVVKNCYMTGNIEVKGEKNACVGGIVGCNGASDITGCYAMGTISVHENKKQCVGHIVGIVKPTMSVTLKSYNDRSITCSNINKNVALNSLFSVSDNSKYTGNIIGCDNESGCYDSRNKNHLTVREADGDTVTQDLRWWRSTIGFPFNSRLWVWNKSLKRPTLYWETVNFENGESVIDKGFEIPERAEWGMIRDNAVWYIKDGALTIKGYGIMQGDFFWDMYRDSITSAVIGDGIKQISGLMFSKHKNLTSITIGANVRSIESNVFSSCENIATVKVKRALPPVISGGMFGTFRNSPISKAQLIVPVGAKDAYLNDKQWKKFGAVIEEDFGEPVIDEGEYFNDPEAQIPEGAVIGYVDDIIWYIKDSVLTITGDGYLSLSLIPWYKHYYTSVIIKGNITRIDKNMFSSHKNLISVTIGANVRSLGDGIFAFCKNIVAVKVKRAEPPQMGALNAFWRSSISKAQLIVPVGAKDAYLNDKQWGKFGAIIEEDFGE
jgi:hypothetical protein